MSTQNSENQKIAKLRSVVAKAKADLEKANAEVELANDKLIKSLIALSDAKGKVAPLSLQEKKVYDLLRKVHYEEHEETTRWWCSDCKSKRAVRKGELDV